MGQASWTSPPHSSLTVFSPSRTTQFRCRITWTTLPCFPASLPSRTSTCGNTWGSGREILPQEPPTCLPHLRFSPYPHRTDASLHRKWVPQLLGAAWSLEGSSSCLQGNLGGSSHSGSGGAEWPWMSRPTGQRDAWLKALRNPLASERPRNLPSQLWSRQVETRGQRSKGRNFFLKHLLHCSVDLISLNPHNRSSSLYWVYFLREEIDSEKLTNLPMVIKLLFGRHSPGWSGSVAIMGAGLRTKGSLVQFPVRAHAWVAGQVPSRERARGNHTLVSLSSALSKNT